MSAMAHKCLARVRVGEIGASKFAASSSTTETRLLRFESSSRAHLPGIDQSWRIEATQFCAASSPQVWGHVGDRPKLGFTDPANLTCAKLRGSPADEGHGSELRAAGWRSSQG